MAHIDQLRGQFRALRNRASVAATREEWMAAVQHRVKALAGDKDPTPEQWLQAAQEAKTVCDRCGGTGQYHWGAVVNGRPTHSGTCFHCNGSGQCGQSDYRRIWGYYNHMRVV